MSKYILSQKTSQAYPKLQLSIRESNDPSEPEARYGYDPIINFFRNEIDNISSDCWKKVRWFINEYDFLVKDPIINRAFYKYWEIINEFDIFEHYKNSDIIFHCAEAPGGFIQGTNIFLQLERLELDHIDSSKTEPDEDGFIPVRSKKNKKPKMKYKIYTISLNKDLPQYKAYNLPSFNRNVLNKQVVITYGQDNTGDINNWDNIKHIGTIAKSPFYLITADGGFDEGTDFNNKEQLHYGLILSEIYAAISLQAENGHFILKIFDLFTETSVHLIYLLSLCYENLYVYKPKTSRPTNSEKYIVCKGFNVNKDYKNYLLKVLNTVQYHLLNASQKHISFTLFDVIPVHFLQSIKNINSKILDKQCLHLKNAVELCSSNTFLTEYEAKLQSAIENRKQTFNEWANTYNLHAYI